MKIRFSFEKFLIFILIAIFVGIGTGIFIGLQKSKLPTYEQKQLTILQDRKLVFSAVKTSVPIESRDLPPILRSLIHAQSKDIAVRKVSYEDDSSGYIVQYNLTGDLFLAFDLYFQALNKKNGWSILGSSRTDTFGIRDVENEVYQIAVTISMPKDNAVEVVVAAKQK